jgi:hypothetical protein
MTSIQTSLKVVERLVDLHFEDPVVVCIYMYINMYMYIYIYIYIFKF